MSHWNLCKTPQCCFDSRLGPSDLCTWCINIVHRVILCIKLRIHNVCACVELARDQADEVFQASFVFSSLKTLRENTFANRPIYILLLWQVCKNFFTKSRISGKGTSLTTICGVFCIKFASCIDSQSSCWLKTTCRAVHESCQVSQIILKNLNVIVIYMIYMNIMRVRSRPCRSKRECTINCKSNL